MFGMDGMRGDLAPRREIVYENDHLPGLEQLSYLTFLMAMMKIQPMMANAMATGNAKL